MAPLDSLPADQRAVLQLVLQRGRTYDDIAAMLSIDRDAVRQRALAGLDALGPDTDVVAEHRAEITDYLLGQLSDDEADHARSLLADAPGERAWARVVAGELSELSAHPLPEIPSVSSKPEPEPHPEPAEAPEGEPEDDRAEGPEAGAPPPPPAPADSATSRVTRALRGEKSETAGGEAAAGESELDKVRSSSRRGGAILLAVVGVLVVVVVIILLVGGGGKNKQSSTAASTPPATTPATVATTPSTPTTASTPTTPTTGTTATTVTTPTSTTTTPTTVVGQINLTSPTAGSKTTGIAEILKQGTTNGIAIVAQNVPANTKTDAYAVWLYNSPTDAHILGFVNPGVTSNGRLSTAGPLPTDASHFKTLIVTRETQASPKTPGTIILQGQLTGLT